MKINIPLELELEDFESVLVTALEGGSNYWYYIPDQPSLKFDESLKGKPLSIKIAYELFNNPEYSLQINDAEDETEILGTITQASLIKAFQDNPEKTLDITNGDYDAWTTDTLFQYAVMGAINFG